MTPPGWYHDPEGSGQLRWWDGNAWTQYLQPVPVAQPVPLVHPPFQPPGVGQAAIAPQQWITATSLPAGAVSPPRSPLFVIVWLGLTAMALGPFLSWITVTSGHASESFKGNQSVRDSWLIAGFPDGYLMLALAALVLILAIAYNGSDLRGVAQWIPVVGFLGIGLGAGSLFAFRNKIDALAGSGRADLISVRPAIGLWIAAVGALVVTIGGIATYSAAPLTRPQKSAISEW